MGLSKLFPCCRKPKPPAREPPPDTGTKGEVSNSKVPPVKDIPDESANDEESPKQEEAESPKQEEAKAPKQDEAKAPKQDEAKAPKQDEAKAPKQDEAKAPKQDMPEEVQDAPPPRISHKVWNRAYDELANDEATKSLVEDYMRAVQKANKSDEDTSTSEIEKNMARMDDQAERERIMRETVESGKKKIYRSTKLTGAVGSASKFVLKFKSVIDLAVQTNPQAALPWAGVCVGLQFLLNPAQESESHQGGIGYVISRMEWYCSLADHLLSDKHIRVGHESFEDVRKRLEERVVDLYKAILLYQMKSASSYYRNQGWTFIRNTISLDDWNSQLDSVKEAETAVENDSKQYSRVKTDSTLGELLNNSQKSQEILGDFHQTLQDYIASQSRKSLGDDYDKCLKDLYVVDPQAQISSLQGRKDTLIPKAYKWILDTAEYQSFTNWSDASSSQVLWLNGPAGTGKTMLMIGIIMELYGQSKLAPGISYFFCIAENTTENSAMDALRSLIWLLLLQQPHLISYLVETHKRSGSAMFHGPTAFWSLRDTFKAMLADKDLSPVYLAFDALDECAEATEESPGVEELISLIAHTLKDTGENSRKIKWLVSSRPEVDVYDKLSRAKEEAVIELDVMARKEPVDAYIDHKLSQLRIEHKYTQDNLDAISFELRRHENITFLWVALVLVDLLSGRVTQRRGKAVDHVKKTPPNLSAMYNRMIEQIEKIDDEEDREFCNNLLKAVCFASRPLSYAEAHTVAGLPSDVTSEEIVPLCGSFLTIYDGTIHLLHHSTGEHLIDYFKSHHDGGAAHIHESMAKRSIIAMSNGLRTNIYNLPPGTGPSDITPPEEDDPLAALRYSCEFWDNHLIEGVAQISDDGPVLPFLETHFLHWLESLGLLHKLPGALLSVRRLLTRTKLTPNESPKLVAFLQDAERFIMKYLSIMMAAPLQIYGGPLIFCPTRSHISNLFRQQKSPYVRNVTGVTEDWDRCLQTLDAAANKIIFSPDGKSFASHYTDSDNETEILRVWDVAVGICVQEFRFDQVKYLDYDLMPNYDPLFFAWLPNSKALIAASGNSVRIFDVATGGWRYENLDSKIGWMELSADGEYMALASNGHIQLWNTSDWTYKRTLGQDGEEKALRVCFAPDSKTLASMSLLGPLKIWNTIDGVCKETLEQSSEWGWGDDLIFPPYDSNLVVLLAKSKEGLMFWDTASGNHKKITFKGTTGTVAALSQDGKTAAVIEDQNVNLVNLADGVCTHKLVHNERISSVAFSKDSSLLVTGSGVIRIWDIASSGEQPSTDIDGDVLTMRFSPDGKVLAMGCSDGTLKLCDPTTNERKHTGERHDEGIWNIVFSRDSSTIATTAGKEVRIWDSSTGHCRRALQPFVKEGYGIYHRMSHEYTTFSPDGKLLAIITSGRHLEAWDTVTGEPRNDFESFDREHLRWIAFSQDGTTFATASGGVRVWDLATKSCKREIWLPHNPMSAQFKESEEWLTCFALAPDGETVITGSYVNATQTSLSFRGTERGVFKFPRMRVWDVPTGKCKQIVDVDFEISDLSFSDDGQSLKTKKGVFEFSSGVLAEAPSSELSRSTLYFDDAWLRQGLEKRLLMPPDYSLSIADSYQNKVVLKGIHGQLVHVDLSDD